MVWPAPISACSTPGSQMTCQVFAVVLGAGFSESRLSQTMTLKSVRDNRLINAGGQALSLANIFDDVIRYPSEACRAS